MTFDLQAAKARAEAKRAEAPTTPPESEITLVETAPKSPEQIQAEIEQAAAEKAIHDQKVLAFKIDQALKEHKALPEGNKLSVRSFAFTDKTDSAIKAFEAITNNKRYGKGYVSSSVSVDVERMCILRLKALTDPVLKSYLDDVDAEFRRTID
ncbi:MAG: hypothetical protein JHC54_01185 [Acinetobacter sp.]|nr:hypothetical protein [Acinetobacter sp.]